MCMNDLFAMYALPFKFWRSFKGIILKLFSLFTQPPLVIYISFWPPLSLHVQVGMPMILSNLAPIGIEFSYLIFEFTFVAPHFTLRHFHLFQQIFSTCQQEDKCKLKCFYLFYIVQMIECLVNSRKPLFRHEMIRNLPSLNLLRCNCLFIWNLSPMCQTFY